MCHLGTPVFSPLPDCHPAHRPTSRLLCLFPSCVLQALPCLQAGHDLVVDGAHTPLLSASRTLHCVLSPHGPRSQLSSPLLSEVSKREGGALTAFLRSRAAPPCCLCASLFTCVSPPIVEKLPKDMTFISLWQMSSYTQCLAHSRYSVNGD